MKKILFLGAILLVTACTGLSYVVDNYSGVELEKLSYKDKVWRVFDKPQENRLMITPSLDAALGGGFVKGLTFGLSGPTVRESTIGMAAQAFLMSKNRKCTITDGSLIVDPQYEFL